MFEKLFKPQYKYRYQFISGWERRNIIATVPWERERMRALHIIWRDYMPEWLDENIKGEYVAFAHPIDGGLICFNDKNDSITFEERWIDGKGFFGCHSI